MKANALRKFRENLSRQTPVYGLWITLESPSICEMAVALGLDWVVIDAEHGHLDWKEICEHVRAAVRSDTVVLVRLAENSTSLIKRALDIGADGVVIPWMESADDLRKAVAAAKYPPHGARGIGAERATCWGQCFVDHVKEAEDNVLVVPIIESVEGARNAAALAAVQGAEVFFFGPADLSATAGFPGEWEAEGVPEAIAGALDEVRKAGKHGGILGRDEADMAARSQQGFRMLGTGIDSGLLLRSLHSMLGSAGRDRRMTPGFTLENDPQAVRKEAPAACAPDSFRPDRPEVMSHPGEGPQIEVAPHVQFDCMVGAFNNAKNLTTGNVRINAGAILPYHRHTFAETVTLLSGAALFEVEGRMYTLEPFDNVSVPAGLAHRVVNLSHNEPAICHIAMNTEKPDRELVETFFSKRSMPRATVVIPNGERYTNYRTAERYDPGKNAAFVDYFNDDLLPGFPMSGGHGLFDPGGRLPAHLHDFDESIFIADGAATCLVEGREYSLQAGSTALQPRGRIHYFINNSNARMTMLWVYAGPMPERLVVDEECAITQNRAWPSGP